ncbi:MAG: hypothetical protein ABR615_06910, partial [Pseudonocardiaceae bacterium]
MPAALLGSAVVLVTVVFGVDPAIAGSPSAAQRAAKLECPVGPSCRFIPAAYAQTAPSRPAYGNYHKADRPRDGDDIRYIVIH